MDVAGRTSVQAYLLLSSNGLCHAGTICQTTATAKLQDDTPDSNTTHYSLIYGTRAREGPAHNLGKKHRTPNPSTEVTFIRFTHFIVALSVLLEEAGKMCLFRRKIHCLYLPICFIIQQPMASALFKDWQHFGHRHLQGETLTHLENTLQREPKHSASSCEGFTPDKCSGHSRKHSLYLLPFFPEGSQTRTPTPPFLHLELFLHLAHLAFESKRFGTCRRATRSKELVVPPELSSFPAASLPQVEFCEVFYPSSLQRYAHSPSQAWHALQQSSAASLHALAPVALGPLHPWEICCLGSKISQATVTRNSK